MAITAKESGGERRCSGRAIRSLRSERVVGGCVRLPGTSPSRERHIAIGMFGLHVGFQPGTRNRSRSQATAQTIDQLRQLQRCMPATVRKQFPLPAHQRGGERSFHHHLLDRPWQDQLFQLHLYQLDQMLGGCGRLKQTDAQGQRLCRLPRGKAVPGVRPAARPTRCNENDTPARGLPRCVPAKAWAT